MRTLEYLLILSAYLLLPCYPVFLFLHAMPNVPPLFLTVSRVAGIYAFVWFSLQFVLTARFKALDRIAGQDRLLMLHMIIAAAALLLTAIHTTFGDEESGQAVQAWFGSAGQNGFLYAGIFSALFFSNFFIRFIPFLISYRNKISKILGLSYERCLWLHYLMPAGMGLILVHVLLLPGKDLSAFKICMAAIAAAGLTSFAWHKFAVPRLLMRSPWKVAEIIPESDTITTLVFESPTGRKLHHHPGQFCYVLPLNGKLPNQAHPFTISSAPEDAHPTITVKHLGDFTTGLKTIECGNLVGLEGAYGRFSCRRVSKKKGLVFIAGGIGITPMLSMLRHLAHQGAERRATLVWGVQDTGGLVRRNEIENLSDKMEDFFFMPILSREQHWHGRKGRIDKELLADVLRQRGHLSANRQPTDVEFFVCGPPPMNASVLRALAELGVDKHRIHSERFAF